MTTTRSHFTPSSRVKREEGSLQPLGTREAVGSAGGRSPPSSRPSHSPPAGYPPETKKQASTEDEYTEFPVAPITTAPNSRNGKTSKWG